MRLVAIVGGIGAGKSVVSRILAALGYDVYDCDSRARLIMDSHAGIKREIAEKISPEAVGADQRIDRAVLSQIVFSNPEKLELLNSIVHTWVKRDLADWAEQLDAPLAFVETAILYQSGLDRMVDEVWEVTAPDELRISRVMSRNNLSRQQVCERIQAQSYQPTRRHPVIKEISNDGMHSLLIQINMLL